MHSRFVSLCLPLIAAFSFLVFVSAASAQVTFDWVTVGDPGNAADDTTYGAVDEVYRISMYEVTNAQYTEFLNAVAADDTYNLYNTYMGIDHVIQGDHGGIARSGTAGTYTYSVRSGRGDWPVLFVTFWDCLRFANWLHNGQPTGAQDDTTTEDGAYTLTTQGIADNTIVANPGATVFLPSEDEWYKAAYYDAGSQVYFDYPAGSDTQTTCTTPGDTANTANCANAVATVTGAGAYTASASPAGTFDQGGNAMEWLEDIASVATNRGLRGGSWKNPAGFFAAISRDSINPANDYNYVGFRVATVPEPGMGALGLTSVLVLAALRRRRA